MKRNLFALLMCLVMACCGIACGEAAGPDLTGVWALDAIVMGEERVSPSMMGLEMTLTVNADGTIVQNRNGEEEISTWTGEGNQLMVDDGAFTYMDGMLTAEEPSMGAVMIFVRASEEKAAASVVTPVAAADIAEFNGIWELTTVSMMGMNMPADMMGMGVRFEVLDGAVKAEISEVLEDGVVETAAFEGGASLLEGALALEMPEGMEDYNITLQLRSDGRAFFEMLQDELMLSMIFEKTAAE